MVYIGFKKIVIQDFVCENEIFRANIPLTNILSFPFENSTSSEIK